MGLIQEPRVSLIPALERLQGGFVDGIRVALLHDQVGLIRENVRARVHLVRNDRPGSKTEKRCVDFLEIVGEVLHVLAGGSKNADAVARSDRRHEVPVRSVARADQVFVVGVHVVKISRQVTQRGKGSRRGFGLRFRVRRLWPGLRGGCSFRGRLDRKGGNPLRLAIVE